MRRTKLDRAAILAFQRGYRIDKAGRVHSPSGAIRTCYVKATSASRYPHCTFNIRVGCEVIPVPFAKLLVYQKYGELAFRPGAVIRHRNGSSIDNRWGNVIIGTRSANALDVPKAQRVARAKKAAKASAKARSKKGRG